MVEDKTGQRGDNAQKKLTPEVWEKNTGEAITKYELGKGTRFHETVAQQEYDWLKAFAKYG